MLTFIKSSDARATIFMLGLCAAGGCVTSSPNPNSNADPNANQAPAQPTVEIGFTDLDSGEYTMIPDGGVMPLFTGLQGGSHIFATFRVSGFPGDEGESLRILLATQVILGAGEEVLHDFSQEISFSRVDESMIFEAATVFLFIDALPNDLDGQVIILHADLTSVIDDTVATSADQSLELAFE